MVTFMSFSINAFDIAMSPGVILIQKTVSLTKCLASTIFEVFVSQTFFIPIGDRPFYSFLTDQKNK